MKNEEILKHLKKLRKQENCQTVVFIVIGILIIGLAVLYFILKCRDKLCVLTEQDAFEDAYVYYQDEEDSDDDYEDFRALDFEDEE